MVRTDILLDDDSIDAVPKTGQFNLMTALDAIPDIQLSPDTAALDLGGGDGSTSFGNATLYTDAGDAHIQLATGRTVPKHATEAAVFAGSDDAGRLLLGRVDESDPRVTLDGDASQAWLGNGADSGRLTVYRGGSSVSQVSTVTLDGDDAAVYAGGGPPNSDAGENGQVTVQDTDNEPVVAATADDGGGGRIALQNGFSQETVEVDGERPDVSGGAVSLHNGSGRETIALEGNPSGSSPRQSVAGGALALSTNSGAETLVLEGSNPDGQGSAIRLSNVSTNASPDGVDPTTVAIEGGGVGRSGELTLSNFAGDDRISLVSTTNTHGSELTLFSQSGTETVAVHGDPPNADGGKIDVKPEGSGGEVSVQAEGGDGGGALSVDNDAGATTGDLDGGMGELTLGTTGSTDATSEGGALRLDDGDGNQFTLEVENGRLSFGFGSGGDVGFELEPSEGEFRVVDGDGDPVFRVDTQDESVEFAKGYSRGTIGSGNGKGGGRGGP